MTKEEWLKQVDEHKVKLLVLIANYHPVNLQKLVGMRITAPNTEAACEVVRQNIRKNFEGNPVTEFEEAIISKDITKIYKLLSDAWFGVPESTACWRIEGFKEAVDLMDDPPDE